MNFVSDFIKAKGYAPSLEEIRCCFLRAFLNAFHRHLSHLEKKSLIHRHKHRREPLELVPVEMDTKARKIILMGRVNVSCTIDNV